MGEKKEVKISLGTAICIFIIILLVISLAVIYYLGVVKNNQTVTEANAIQVESTNIDVSNGNEEVQELDKDSELVQKLYSKILKQSNIAISLNEEDSDEYEIASFYKDDKVTVENLSKEEKVIAILTYLAENNMGTEAKFADLEDDILENLGNMFGNGDGFNLIELKEKGEIDTQDDKYGYVDGRCRKPNYI